MSETSSDPLQYMLEKAKGYRYKRADFILDRGYFSKENIQYMDECGYDFVIITSHKMTAKEAIELYKSRDSSEKLFRGDKSYLGKI